MKKLLIIISMTAILLSLAPVSMLQAQGYCASITTTNYPQCCPPRGFPETADGTNQLLDQQKRCRAFTTTTIDCTLRPSDPICNPIQGGTQSTGAQNTGTNSTPSDSGIKDNVAASCKNIQIKSLLDFLIWVKCIIVVGIIPLIFALAFLFFLWTIFRSLSANSPESKKEARRFMWWGIIALFVMVSVWGIVRIITTFFGVDNLSVPTLQTEYLDPNKANKK